MTSTVFAVICLAAGFYAGSRWKVSQVYVAKDSGHPLYFLSALIATVLLVFSFGADKAFSNFAYYENLRSIINNLLEPLVDPRELMRLTHATVLVIWVIVAGFLLPRLFNFPLKKNANLLDQIAEKYGEREAIDDLVKDTLKLQLPLAVTLDESKIYIGFPIAGEPFGVASKRWLRLRPMFSGYRDENRELHLTTDYQPVISLLTGSDGISAVAGRAFDVVVPFERIVSAHPFDLESYKNYFLGDDWSESDQQIRLIQLSELSESSGVDNQHKLEYWLFVALALSVPVACMFSFYCIALIVAALSLAFGVQSSGWVSGATE